MPQPTRPASVMITQYCPLCQRLLMPTAQPFLNCSGRDIVRGSGSLIDELLAQTYRFALGGYFGAETIKRARNDKRNPVYRFAPGGSFPNRRHPANTKR